MAAGEIHTKPGPKGWRNTAGTRHISNHKTKALAEKAGRKVAMERSGLAGLRYWASNAGSPTARRRYRRLGDRGPARGTCP
jgi:hypothetical protein